MANKKDYPDFPGLLVVDPRDFDNAPFGADAADYTAAAIPGAMRGQGTAMPQMQPLTWAEKNIAPALGNIYDVNGLSSVPVQGLATGLAKLYRNPVNALAPGVGDNIWPKTSTGNIWETGGEGIADEVKELIKEYVKKQIGL